MHARPDSATQRYDRQLRLWAPSGQAALERARVLILGTSGLAAQCAKNLVLPGIGEITIADAGHASEADVGANFFLDDTCVGRERAPEVARRVGELNPATRCVGIVAPPLDVARDAPLVGRHAIVIAVRQAPDVCDAAADTCERARPPIPLIVTDSSGFSGMLSLDTPELALVETHPPSVVDLRLTRPFPALDAHVDAVDLAALDSYERSHVPYVVLIRKALATTPPERAALRAALDRLRTAADQENVDEAVAALPQHVWRPLGAPPVPPHVQHVLDLVPARAVDAAFVADRGVRAARFWTLAAALRRFVAAHGVLPLPGAVPDMKASSQRFVALQHVYRTKAREDLDAFSALVDDVLAAAHLSRAAVGIADDDVRTFVRHAGALHVVGARTWADRLRAPAAEAITAAFDDPVNPPTIQHYLAYVATRAFQVKYGRFPGQASCVDDDRATLVTLCTAYAARTGIALHADATRLVQRACAEMVRGARADHPPTAALLGGVVAQEAVKLVTAQYIPANNTCIYDGIAQAIGSFVL